MPPKDMLLSFFKFFLNQSIQRIHQTIPTIRPDFVEPEIQNKFGVHACYPAFLYIKTRVSNFCEVIFKMEAKFLQLLQLPRWLTLEQFQQQQQKLLGGQLRNWMYQHRNSTLCHPVKAINSQRAE